MTKVADRGSLLRDLWDQTVAVGNRLLDIPAILLALAYTAVGAVAVFLIPAENAAAVAIGGVALLAFGVPWSLWRASIAGRELTKTAEFYARHDSVPADPAATRDLPAAILRPEDATDTVHLDRILARNRADWPEPDDSYRRLTVAGRLLVVLVLASGTLLVGAMIALVVSTLSPADDPALAVRAGLSFAVAIPALTLSRIATSMRDQALVDEAAQWDRAQALLDSGVLADNGSELRVIHRGTKLQVAVRRASYALRPRPKHFATARRDVIRARVAPGVARARVTGVTLVIAFGAMGVTLATFSAARG